ncbi:probable G-protein coupled receptor 34b [Hippocampus zosterae]|uniref:probable G-protein coupled receptor 34b n=1 Tax=Hippocampus zosterae TaxID=109293 RepID=UPI00223E2BB5|nr:probable G-protein coupled receptor 34b [Hippocampus zosterae]
MAGLEDCHSPYIMSADLQTSISPFVNGINLTMAPDPQQPCVDYDALQWPLAVLYSVIFALGLLGNLMALWALFHVHSKRNSVRVFLINVAFADLLLVVCLPFRILYHARGNVWTLGPTLCNVVGNFFYMNMYISITLLGLISVDRYLKIHQGTLAKSRLQSTGRSTAICVAIWIIAFGLASAFFMPKTPSQVNRCFHYKELHDAKWKAYINICMLLVFWLVFISLVVSYVKIALKLLRRSQNKPDLPNAHRYSRTARKSFFILFLFTVCFVPYHVIRVFYIKTQITNTSCFWKGVADKANELALLFSALNTCLDPVLLLLLLSSVRKEVRRLMANMFRTRDTSVGVSGSSSTVEMEGRTGRPDRGQVNVPATLK